MRGASSKDHWSWIEGARAVQHWRCGSTRSDPALPCPRDGCREGGREAASPLAACMHAWLQGGAAVHRAARGLLLCTRGRQEPGAAAAGGGGGGGGIAACLRCAGRAHAGACTGRELHTHVYSVIFNTDCDAWCGPTVSACTILVTVPRREGNAGECFVALGRRAGREDRRRLVTRRAHCVHI